MPEPEPGAGAGAGYYKIMNVDLINKNLQRGTFVTRSKDTGSLSLAGCQARRRLAPATIPHAASISVSGCCSTRPLSAS